jgi:hypothetical protein
MPPHDPESTGAGEFPERKWITLNTSHDIEGWIVNYDRDLQRTIGNARVDGCGICFRLAEGGEIFLHTTPDGEVLLDITPEAEWATPVIAASTGSAPPAARIWVLPGHVLTQLVLGLSSLIAATRIVANHDFSLKKSWKRW